LSRWGNDVLVDAKAFGNATGFVSVANPLHIFVRNPPKSGSAKIGTKTINSRGYPNVTTTNGVKVDDYFFEDPADSTYNTYVTSDEIDGTVYTAPMYINVKPEHNVKLYYVDGNVYIDFSSGIYVTTLGHCHPKVVEAIQKYAAQLMNCHDFTTEIKTRLMEKLAQVMPGDLRGFHVDLHRVPGESPLLELDPRCLEGVGLDDLGARFEHRAVDALDHVGAVQDERLVALAGQAAVVLAGQLELLEGRAHAAVVDDDPAVYGSKVVTHACEPNNERAPRWPSRAPRSRRRREEPSSPIWADSALLGRHACSPDGTRR
jgi:hypothetical protein